MALADFLQALLRQPGGPQAALADAASAQGSAGPNGSAAYQNALQAAFQQQVTPQNPYMAGNPSGLLSTGNIDLYHRPIVHNPDGSISTVRSMSFGEDGKEILVPTVSPDGKILTDQQAIDQYHKTGQNLGVFDNPKDATVYANSLHNQQANLYVKPQASSGGIGDFLQGLINPQARGRNQTVHWLQNQGMDAGTATLLAGDKTLLRNYLGSRIQGNSPEEALKLQKLQLEVGNLKNPTTDDIREFNLAKKQGYNGSFLDYLTTVKKAGAQNINLPGQPNIGTIPQGFAAKQDPATGNWTMYPIPGGPADTSQTEAAKTAGQTTKTDVITNAYKTASSLVGDSTTGLIGQGLGYIPPTNAAELRRQIGVLKANATIENLNAMRQQSKTGGALGNVTEKEGQMLASAAGALDPNASPEQFKSALDNYYRTLLRIVNGPEAGDQIFNQMSGNKNAAPQRIDKEEDYILLPKGSQYIAPDGSVRTKQ